MSAPIEVPLLELRAQYAPLRDEIEQAIREVCDSQRFVLGPRVTQLEHEIAAYSGAEHAVGVSSGTDALLLALMSLGIGPGDEVITSPFTFFATGGVIARLGARPAFCDIDPSSFNLSVEGVARYIERDCVLDEGRLVNRTSRAVVKAVMPVHLFGQTADMRGFMELADRYPLRVVEDAAQAIGAELEDGRRAGGIGDIGCFSFFPTKNLGAFGDAGMCVCSVPELAERMRILRVHGGERRYFHSVVGGNFRLDELQAAVLLVKLKHLDDWTARRQANAARYERLFLEAGLAETIVLPRPEAGRRHIYNQYVIRAPHRDALKSYLASEGIGTAIYYPLPLHQQECFAYLGYAEEAFPNAVRAARESLALPIFPELSPVQIEAVVAAIGRFFASQIP